MGQGARDHGVGMGGGKALLQAPDGVPTLKNLLWPGWAWCGLGMEREDLTWGTKAPTELGSWLPYLGWVAGNLTWSWLNLQGGWAYVVKARLSHGWRG